jgi:cytochrome c553
MVRYPSSGYDPNMVKPEALARCTVCGWAGIDLVLYTSAVEIAPIVFETDAETGITVTTASPYAACAFCHSPNFDGGSAPDLRW